MEGREGVETWDGWMDGIGDGGRSEVRRRRCVPSGRDNRKLYSRNCTALHGTVASSSNVGQLHHHHHHHHQARTRASAWQVHGLLGRDHDGGQDEADVEVEKKQFLVSQCRKWNATIINDTIRSWRDINSPQMRSAPYLPIDCRVQYSTSNDHLSNKGREGKAGPGWAGIAGGNNGNELVDGISPRIWLLDSE